MLVLILSMAALLSMTVLRGLMTVVVMMLGLLEIVVHQYLCQIPQYTRRFRKCRYDQRHLPRHRAKLVMVIILCFHLLFVDEH